MYYVTVDKTCWSFVPVFDDWPSLTTAFIASLHENAILLWAKAVENNKWESKSYIYIEVYIGEPFLNLTEMSHLLIQKQLKWRQKNIFVSITTWWQAYFKLTRTPAESRIGKLTDQVDLPFIIKFLCKIFLKKLTVWSNYFVQVELWVMADIKNFAMSQLTEEDSTRIEKVKKMANFFEFLQLSVDTVLNVRI